MTKIAKRAYNYLNKYEILQPTILYCLTIWKVFRKKHYALFLRSLRPISGAFKRPNFSGWGMTTEHLGAWEGNYELVFRKTSQEIKNFHLSKGGIAGGTNNTDSLLWRHWNIAFGIRYATEFSRVEKFTLVEVGVGDGLSTFYALKEIEQMKLPKFEMHLYDTWGQLSSEDFDKNESSYIYCNLNLDRTKKNLTPFLNNLVFHQGYVPNTFDSTAPNSISYLHIDLSTADAYLFTLEFFYPKLGTGGIIIFDDYGGKSHHKTKDLIDNFLHGKPGVLQKLPTRQAIFYKH